VRREEGWGGNHHFHLKKKKVSLHTHQKEGNPTMRKKRESLLVFWGKKTNFLGTFRAGEEDPEGEIKEHKKRGYPSMGLSKEKEEKLFIRCGHEIKRKLALLSFLTPPIVWGCVVSLARRRDRQ